MQKCPACGDSTTESDTSSGSIVCTSCGFVINDISIVSELNFYENSFGTSTVVGQFVPGTGPRSFSSSGRGIPMGHTRASRDITLQMAKIRISGISSQLSIPITVSESAQNIYSFAARTNFISGRRQNTVYAACQYFACRRAKTSHMLIDFAQFMNANVFVLGNAVLKLTQVLNLRLPIVDPSLYMHRFASEMDQGNQSFSVANTALRLLAHMRRNWIHTGRRPSGICGACLLIASRMHNFSRTPKEIAQIVRIGESVLRSRLGEFSNTSSVSLTTEDIEALDIPSDPKLLAELEAGGDSISPPAFQKLQIRSEKIRRLRQILETRPNLAKLVAQSDENIDDDNYMSQNIYSDSSLEDLVKQIDKTLNADPVLETIYKELIEAQKVGNSANLYPFDQYNDTDDTNKIEQKHNQQDDSTITTTTASIECSVNSNIENKNNEIVTTNKIKNKKIDDDTQQNRAQILKAVIGEEVIDDTVLELIEDELAITAPRSQLSVYQRKLQNMKKIKKEFDNDNDNDSIDKEKITDKMGTTNIETLTSISEIFQLSNDEICKQIKIEREQEIIRATNELRKYSQFLKIQSLNIDEIDDDEVDSIILSEEESQTKRKLWQHLNEDFLALQEDKLSIDKKNLLDNIPIKKKVFSKAISLQSIQQKAEKKLSEKINYQALENLNRLDYKFANTIRSATTPKVYGNIGQLDKKQDTPIFKYNLENQNNDLENQDNENNDISKRMRLIENYNNDNLSTLKKSNDKSPLQLDILSFDTIPEDIKYIDDKIPNTQLHEILESVIDSKNILSMDNKIYGNKITNNIIPIANLNR